MATQTGTTHATQLLMTDKYTLPQHDVDILRQLAERQVEIAQSPLNLERKALWYKHDAGMDGRPMILAEVFGVRDQISPLPNSDLKCENSWSRGIEWLLRFQIYQFEVLKDDHVIEPYFNVGWSVQMSDYGVQPIEHTADNEGRMAGRRWDPPIQDLDKDFHKLHPRTYSVDREATLARKQSLEKVFGDILPVRIRGMFGMLPWTMGMTEPAMKLHGLENLMLSTLDNLEGVHRLMTLLRDDHIAYAEWLEEEGLLTLNNENDYVGSGTIGYTHDLPQSGERTGEPARLKDLWVLLESQETVGVGPKQFEELFFPYQLSVAQKFGKCYYGCCEPVNKRWHILKRIPNLARVSVSPWADEEFMAQALGSDIVYCRKPNPALISTEHFDEDWIRADIRNTLTIAKGCRIEIVMKDVHTLNNEPGRLPRWVQIAREEVDKMS